jgi:hypothetical protein
VEIRGKTRDEMRAVLDQLDPSDFEEIRLAIDAHIAAQARLHAVEKNGQGGESTSPAISPSLDAAAGAMSGSPS